MSIINGITLESDKSIHVVSVSLVIFENFAIIVKKIITREAVISQ